MLVLVVVSLFSCNTASKKEANATTTIAISDSTKTSKSIQNTETQSITVDSPNTASPATLLQGKWQHTEDTTNFLVFEGNNRKEIAEGMTDWQDEAFILSNTCSNPSNKDSGIELENDKYISCPASDLCWYIVSIDKENLTLSYMGRGNTLTYKRVH